MSRSLMSPPAVPAAGAATPPFAIEDRMLKENRMDDALRRVGGFIRRVDPYDRTHPKNRKDADTVNHVYTVLLKEYQAQCKAVNRVELEAIFRGSRAGSFLSETAKRLPCDTSNKNAYSARRSCSNRDIDTKCSDISNCEEARRETSIPNILSALSIASICNEATFDEKARAALLGVLLRKEEQGLQDDATACLLWLLAALDPRTPRMPKAEERFLKELRIAGLRTASIDAEQFVEVARAWLEKPNLTFEGLCNQAKSHYLGKRPNRRDCLRYPSMRVIRTNWEQGSAQMDELISRIFV